jgi:hypothetical protein
MTGMSKDRETLHAVVIVVFRRKDGHVIGTFVHGSHGRPDPVAAEHSCERFMKEMRAQHRADADLDSLLVPLSELEGRWIKHVDPNTRTIVKSGPKTGGPVVFNPSN